MKGLNEQVWVTSAVVDDDVEKALILCYSLRRACTSRQLAVITSHKLSTNLKRALNHGFDYVFYLDEEENMALHLKPEEFAKLYSLLALKCKSTCAYVAPYMLALKNCDDIFSKQTNDVVLIENDEKAEVFLFKPSMKNYMALENILRSCKRNGSGIGKFLKKLGVDYQFNRQIEMLDKKYNLVLNKGQGLVDFECNISMVNLLEYPEICDMEELRMSGILGNLIAIYWSKIREDDVGPLLITKENLMSQCAPHQLQYSKEPIAIVGMSCRYPGSNNLEEFWDLLFEGRDGTSSPPPFRWMREQCSKSSVESRKTNAGFLKLPVDQFDAKFFGISPKEALCMDPQHRLLHELVWEGLEDACVNPHMLRGTSGSVFMGSWTNDYKDILMQSGNSEFYRAYMGNSIGAATARLSFLLGLSGPSIATESGCSSAMVAVHLACRSLQNGETNLAITGGVNLLLNPFDKDTMPMVISPDGLCKTFSEDANGFARAEGCGVLVLKRLSDAVKDQDNIWAVIRGSAVAQEGISNSMGTPTVYCESLAMEEALKDAGVGPEEVSYVEAHGTGTRVGDPMEVAAIAKAYYTPARKEPLVIGSVKTNVGHTESCSGITGIMKVVLGMHHETIPAHRNISKINASIDLNAIPAVIPLESMEWKRGSGIRRVAGVSSFGITGTDAHVIIEESPEFSEERVLAADNHLDRPLHLLKISAKTEEALEILLEKYKAKLLESQDDFPDIAFSSNCGRANFPYRAALIARTNEDAISCIDKRNYLREEVGVESHGKICFLFTGQGCQYPGMAKRLYDCSPIFQMYFDRCNKILEKNYQINLKKVLWSSNSSGGSGEEIDRTIYSQTSIFCVEYALLKLWESWGVKPDYVLGHSLGEFGAAVCVGIISVDDAIKLVAERSKLIDGLPQGKMLVIQADYKKVQNEMQKFAGGDVNKMLDYAAINSSEQTVVAGDSDVVMEFSKFCTGLKSKCMVLASTHAFHSKHMDPMLEKYKAVANSIKGIPAGRQACEYISGMRGNVISMEEVNAEYWVEHTREKVNFLKASQKAVELGCKIFIEIGPQPVLSALTMMNNDDVNLLCLPSLKRKEEEWLTILNTVGKLYVKGTEIDWSGLDQFYNRKKVRLPHYPWIGKVFWPDMGKITTGNTIHPLIGSVLPNASSIKIFQNGVNLSTHSYLKDHAIGQTVVFPGAGFLEMCLAAGLATVEDSTNSLSKPIRPMKIENLMIKAPLALGNGKTCQFQTTVEMNTLKENKNEWNDMTIKVFHRQETDISESWLEHATATFSPLPTAEDLIISFDLEDFRETLLQPSNDNLIDELYDKLASLGMKFGPVFRSLEKVWKNEDNNSLLAKVKVPEDISGKMATSYIIHPVILDAMIHSIVFLKLAVNSKTKLFVPIRIGNFLWISNPKSELSDELYIQITDSSSTAGDEITGISSSSLVLLLDSVGTVLALMTQVEFIDTTVKAVEAVLEQQTLKMPDLWEETWRPSIGPLQYRHDLDLCRKERFYDDKFLENLNCKFNELTRDKQDTFTKLERLAYLNFVRCLLECGWVPKLNEIFTEETFIEQLGIQKEFGKMLRYILTVLEEEGILENVGLATTWKLINCPPSSIEIEAELSSSIFTVDLVKIFNPTLLLSEIGKNYCGIFKGTQSALPIMFPEDPSKSKWPPVANFYTDYGKCFNVTEMYTDVANAAMKYCKGHVSSKGERNILRILEIGAGTGFLTNAFLEVVYQNDVEVEYTFTDISPAFFATAEKTLEPYLKEMTFKKLNIEEDPVSQGFTPNYYDYVIASDVIHATRNLSETLENIRMVVKLNGKFLMMEQTRKNRIITYLFGVLEGFWRFDDIDIRPDHCTLAGEKWKEILELGGFHVLETFPSLNYYHSLIYSLKSDENFKCLKGNSVEKYWILFHQDDSPTSQFLLERIQSSTNRNVITVRRGRKYKSKLVEKGWNFEIQPDCERDFEEFVNFCGRHIGANIEGIIYAWSLEKIWTTQDSILQPYFLLVKSFVRRKELATCLKMICLVSGIMPVEDNDLINFHSSTLWGFTKALRNERMDIQCRCIEIGGKDDEEEAEQVFFELWSNDNDTQVAFINNTKYNCKLQGVKPVISNLKITNGLINRFKLVLPETRSIGDLQFGILDPFCLDENQVEVQIKASALNFKDIFNILKPSDDFKDSNAVGFDFAGIVKRVGDRVYKWSVGDRVFGLNMNGDPLPSHVKVEEEDLVGVPRGMTLCDACTLPAVVATSYHCLVEVAHITSEDTVLIHTASGGVGLSAIQICKNVGATIIATAGSKRKQNYLRGLGIQHVFHSRNTDYGEEILKVTNGHGVSVVLNSLTSEGFKEATLKACSRNARFVEMSKLSIWTPEQVKELRPDVHYTIVDLSSMDKQNIRRLMNIIKNLADGKIVSPIPYVRFDSVQIQEALQYLQKAKHIGKVVCVMPEIRGGAHNGSTDVYTPIFNDNATYLITGGLGGIGFAICQWMVEKGAKFIILAGRSVPSEKLIRAIEGMRDEKGVEIIPVQLDVSRFEECRELIEVKICKMGLPQLKGIMHAAGTLNDGLIENQTWEKLSSTFKTKVDGTLNLHELTKNLNLEHFVMFSSMVATFGSPGQCNHAAGNIFEDTFAHYRNFIGLPATSVNWGEVGIATEVDLPGVKALSNLQATTGLEFALKTHRPQTGIFNIESFYRLSKLYPQVLHILDEREWKSKSSGSCTGGEVNMSSDEFWQRYDMLDGTHAKMDMVKGKLRVILGIILKLDRAEFIEEHANFQELGIDSLMFVEMKNAIQTLLGSRAIVNVSAMKECNTVGLLADVLLKIIEGKNIQEEINPTTDEVAALIKEDCQLAELIVAKPDQVKVNIKDVSRVFLTGCSGTLGPYLLKELSNIKQVKEIICLMRPSKNMNGEERLIKILEERHLLNQVDMSKVRCCKGNVALNKLGMEKNAWEELCNSVDAIFHCAVSVQHMEQYRKRDSDSDMRAVNIQGTKNILELASTGNKLKQVYCASSLAAVATVGEDGRFSEDWPKITDYDGVTTLAYSITKFVGDILMKQAILERGIPGKVFRFPMIMGDSKTGRFVLDQNHAMLRYMYILQQGMMPSTPFILPMLPVDTCAWASVQIFFNPGAPDDIFNVSNATPGLEQEFVGIAERLGYNVDIVEFGEFSEKIRESTPADSPFAIFKDFYRNDEYVLSLYSTLPVLKEYILRGGSDESFLVSKKIAGLLPKFYDDVEPCTEQIYRDMLFAKSEGWFEKFNL